MVGKWFKSSGSWADGWLIVLFLRHMMPSISSAYPDVLQRSCCYLVAKIKNNISRGTPEEQVCPSKTINLYQPFVSFPNDFLLLRIRTSPGHLWGSNEVICGSLQCRFRRGTALLSLTKHAVRFIKQKLTIISTIDICTSYFFLLDNKTIMIHNHMFYMFCNCYTDMLMYFSILWY